MDTSKECPICRREAQQSRKNLKLPIWTYECATCGRYTITLIAKQDILPKWWTRQDMASLAKLSAFVKERTLRDSEGVTLRREGQSSESLPGPVFTLEEALNAFPHSISERIDRALLNLAHLAPNLGSWFTLQHEINYPTVYTGDAEESKYLVRTLDNLGYIDSESQTNKTDTFRLTADGWQHIDELKHRPAEKPRQGFVAMWFGDALMKARKEGFEAGIEAAGYEALVIADRDDFNEDIHDQIIAEIRKSRFVVADFTENRPNVYYEAGFAEALGKPVIYTCHKDHIDETHFDIRQRNHIVWEDGEIDQLRERLRNRIEATIGLPAS